MPIDVSSTDEPLHTSNILVHYAEIATKGKNRPDFINCLARNIRRALSGLPVAQVKVIRGRLWVTARRDAQLDAEAFARLRTVYGIASFSPAVRTPLDLDAIKQCALSLARRHTYESFRVTARRSFKDLPFPSQDLNRDVGAFLLEHRPAQVKMKGADLTVYIEELPEGAYVYVDKHPGLGGLPVGIGGTVAVLLSGGIDSPVAAFRMQRRGLRNVFVHFHSHPFHTRASQEKAVELARHLARFQHDGVLYLVPFGELQREVVTNAPAPLRVVLYRRFMLRIAAELAQREGARALVTGEALGQVASQTLDNLVVIDRAAPIPVLRPLIGCDKQEIIDQAKALGTYETSIIPDQDCCQLFMPRKPETRAKDDAVQRAEAALSVQALCTDALERSERQVVRAPWWGADKRPKQAADPDSQTSRPHDAQPTTP